MSEGLLDTADGMEEAGLRTLRAKYLDWCSARIAERFLDLGPEEIYDLAHPEGESEPDAPPPSLPAPTDEGYRALVQRVTEALLGRMALPTFEQWSEAYRDSPERFDGEMLGFWKDGLEGGAP